LLSIVIIMPTPLLPLALLIAAMTVPTLAAVLYFVVFAGSPLAAVLYTATKLLMLALPLATWWRWRLPPAPHRQHGWRQVGEGLVLGALMAGAILLLTAVGPFATVYTESIPRITTKIAEIGLTTPLIYLAATLVISLLHSAYEEWYWRGCVFGHLARRTTPLAAHLVAGLAFAGHHIVIAGVYAGPAMGVVLGLVVGAAGVCWSLLYRRHGTLLGAWLAHAACDVALMYLGWQAMHRSGA
jgi:membrane protease YdiL (CAAX protease family)